MASLSVYQYLNNISESTDHWSSIAKCLSLGVRWIQPWCSSTVSCKFTAEDNKSGFYHFMMFHMPSSKNERLTWKLTCQVAPKPLRFMMLLPTA